MHDYYTNDNIIIILLILNNAFSYLLLNPKAFSLPPLVTTN